MHASNLSSKDNDIIQVLTRHLKHCTDYKDLNNHKNTPWHKKQPHIILQPYWIRRFQPRKNQANHPRNKPEKKKCTISSSRVYLYYKIIDKAEYPQIQHELSTTAFLVLLSTSARTWIVSSDFFLFYNST